MFRRLAALSNQQTAEGFNAGEAHYNFVENQNYRYNTLIPNAIPTANTAPVPQTVNDAMRTVNPATGRATDVLPDVNRLFVQNSLPASMRQQADTCATGSLDGLITSSGTPKPSVGCGWAYTAPLPGSAIPQTSVGALGTVDGPFPFTRPSKPHAQWFWDLRQAKKQVLTDTCKALRNCADVNSATFNSICGFCTELGQGIPIDANGRPLYPEGNLTNCSANAIVTRASACPPVAAGGAGGPMLQDDTCTPIDGKLPVGCIQRIVNEGGCKDGGALAIALSEGARPGDYMAGARVLPSLTLYNRHMNPPLDIAAFAQPGPTVRNALKEHVSRLAAATTSQPATSAIGAAARDLCLQRGAIDQFDFCGELADGTPPPFDMNCVRKLFLAASGNPAGALYPTVQTMASTYNTKPNWKAVKDFIAGLRARASGSVDGFADIGTVTRDTYNQQAAALQDLRGIRPEQLGNRPPAVPGVEMFWFDTRSGVLLNVTTDRYFPTYSWDAGPIPQAFGRNQYVQFVGLTDVRVRQPTSMKFKFVTDDGVIMTLNKPIALNGPNYVDTADTFSANIIQGAREYANKTCWQMVPDRANVMKVYWHDKGGGHHTFSLTGATCSGASAYEPIRGLALTRELGGPILQFENTPQGDFADLRMPEFFSFNVFGNGKNNVQVNAKADDKLRAPGKNGFVRIAGGQSFLALKNLSMTAWTAMTFVFRLQTSPVSDTLLSMRMTGGGQVVQVYLTPSTTGACMVNYRTNVGGTEVTQPTGVQLSTGQWYMGVIQQVGVPATSLSIVFNKLESAMSSSEDWHRQPSRGLSITNRGAAITNAPEQTEIVMGTQSNGSLQWDLAWWHVFNTELRPSVLQRDARNDWMVAM